MTLQGAIEMADELKPNMMSTAAKIAFINEIEGIIFSELIMTHEHTLEEETRPVYDVSMLETAAATETEVETEETEGTEEPEEEEEEDEPTELLIPSPYDMLYPYWIISKIDHQNQEMDKYNNDRALFENAYQQAADWINRTRRPIRRVREIRI